MFFNTVDFAALHVRKDCGGPKKGPSWDAWGLKDRRRHNGRAMLKSARSQTTPALLAEQAGRAFGRPRAAFVAAPVTPAFLPIV